MAHLSDETIYRVTFERAALDTEEAGHLSTCVECQARAAESSDLANALLVARHSEPTVKLKSDLLALASLVQTSSAGRRIVDWVRAQLTMDTRTGLSATGMRGPSVAYRMLYSTRSLDIELMVEPANGTRSIQGVLLPLGESDEEESALVQLESDGRILLEGEATAGGRFTFAHVPPGSYRLWVVRADSADVIIENLEID